MSKVVVVGAAGLAGRHLLRELGSRDVEVVAVSHSEAGEARLREEGVGTVVRADLNDAAGLRYAFSGADVVHVIPPARHPDEDVLAENAIRAAVAAGVPRFVYLSVLHPNTPFLRNHIRKAKVETFLRETQELRWTILQPSTFAQAMLAMYGATEETEPAVPFDIDQPIAVIDLADLAIVSADAILDDSHDYATYELPGPMTSMGAIVEAVGRQRGIPMQARRVSVLDGPSMPIDAILPAAAADLIATYAYRDEHAYRGNTRVFTYLLGRPPTPFAEVAARELS